MMNANVSIFSNFNQIKNRFSIIVLMRDDIELTLQLHKLSDYLCFNAYYESDLFIRN